MSTPASRAARELLQPLDAELTASLRSDHAGEAGAVAIYQGVLAVARADELRHFARHHLRTECRHLRFFEESLPPRCRTRLLPVWRLAGWSLGAGSSLLGARALYTTIAAVETFVDAHYREQIEHIGDDPRLQGLRHALESFRLDEVAHRDDAASHLQEPGVLARLWQWIVGAGSALGVVLARRL